MSIRSILQNFANGSASRSVLSKQEIGTAFRAMLTEGMPCCSVCGQQVTDHQYQRLACAAIEPDQRQDYLAMIEAVRGLRWEDLRRFQNWKATSADADVYLLKCADGRYNLIVVYCPYELGDIYKVIHQEQVASEDVPVFDEAWQQV